MYFYINSDVPGDIAEENYFEDLSATLQYNDSLLDDNKKSFFKSHTMQSKITESAPINNNNFTTETSEITKIYDYKDNEKSSSSSRRVNGFELVPGDLIFANSVKIVKFIAEGGQAKVYLGYIEEIKEEVAVKRYCLEGINNPYLEKIQEECDNLKELDNEFIVKYYDLEIEKKYVESDSYSYMVKIQKLLFYRIKLKKAILYT